MATVEIIIEAENRASRTLKEVREEMGGLSRLSDGLSGALRGAVGNIQTLGVVAVGAVGAATAGVGALGAALGKVAFDAMPVEALRSAFEGLAEAAGSSADEMLAVFEEATGGMVAQRDVMMSFNKAAQLVGLDFAKNLPEAMQYLGKVAAATGQDMGFLMDSLVVGVGRLSPMILDNLGIQVSLAEATERAAEMFGVEADELTKAQQQAGMMSVVLEKLQQNTAAMPDVTQTAAGQWAAFRASLTDLRDEIGLALLPILSDFLAFIAPLAQQYAPVLAQAVRDLVAAVQPWAVVMQDVLLTLMDAGPLSSEFGEALGLIHPRLTDIAFALMGVYDAIAPVIAQVVDAVARFVSWQDVLAALGVAIASVVLPAIAGLVASLAPVIATAALVVGAISALRQAWENDFYGIRTVTLEVITTVRDFIQNALAAMRAFWQEHGDSITTATRTAWQVVSEVVQRYLNVVSEVFAAFRAAFEGDWRAFGEHLRAAFDAQMKNIVDLARWVGDTIRGIDWGAVGRAIVDGIAAGVRAGAGAIADAARSAAAAALDAAKGFLGIRSPSRVMAERVGKPAAEGLAEGLMRAVPQVEAAMRVAISPLVSPPAIPAAVASAPTPTSVNVNMYIEMRDAPADPRDFAERVAVVLREELRRAL